MEVIDAPASLHHRLSSYLEPCKNEARVLFAPADIIWSDDECVQPDLFVVPAREVTGNWRDFASEPLATVATPTHCSGRVGVEE